MYRKKALYKKKKVPVKPEKKKDTFFKLKEIKGEKNGGKRAVLLRKSVCFLIEHTAWCEVIFSSSHSVVFIPLRMSLASFVLASTLSHSGCAILSHQEQY